MGYFGGINEANPDGNKVKLSKGTHDVSIDRCMCVEGFKSGLTYVIEVKIISSSDPAYFPGMEASTTITGLDDKVKGKMQLGRIKAFLSVMYGLNALDPIPCPGYTWETLADATAPDPLVCPPEKHPLHGQCLRITRVDKRSDGGFDYPLWGFESIPTPRMAA
jgi:hypothetical protein